MALGLPPSKTWAIWLAGVLALVCVTWTAVLHAPTGEEQQPLTPEVELPKQADGHQKSFVFPATEQDLRLHLVTPEADLGAHIASGARKDDKSYFFSIGDFGVAQCEVAHKAGQDDEDGGIGHWACSKKTQLSVAEQMARLAEGLKPEFVLSLGDNFYVRGVRDLEDPQFQGSFEAIYDRGALSEVPWKISIGDHDQRGNISALLMHTKRSPRWRLPAPYYTFQVKTPSGQRHIEVIVCDSVALEGAADPKVIGKRRFKEDLSEEFAGRAAGEAHWRWLEDTLGVSGASGATGPKPALRIVVAHRPVVSVVVRDRSDADREVQHRLLDLLRKASANGPILFLHGHDHAMQHWVDANGALQHVGNGVGGLNLHPLRPDMPEEFRWGASKKYGFAVHEVGEASLATYFVDADGKVLHSVDFPFVAA